MPDPRPVRRGRPGAPVVRGCVEFDELQLAVTVRRLHHRRVGVEVAEPDHLVHPFFPTLNSPSIRSPRSPKNDRAARSTTTPTCSSLRIDQRERVVPKPVLDEIQRDVHCETRNGKNGGGRVAEAVDRGTLRRRSLPREQGHASESTTATVLQPGEYGLGRTEPKYPKGLAKYLQNSAITGQTRTG